MKRKIISYLQDWRTKKDRRPLIVNGARQVGKTYSVREPGQDYASFIEINFITHPAYKRIFENDFYSDEIVNDFIKRKDFSNILELQRQLCMDYEQDVVKYAVGMEKAKIRNVYRNIPVFLFKENKKFQISKVASDARSRNYQGSVDWLCDAGIVHRCYALNYPELPLKGDYNETKFKLYFRYQFRGKILRQEHWL